MAGSSKLARDTQETKIQAFVLEKVVPVGTSITPNEDMLICLGGNVTIAVDGVGVEMLQGKDLVLKKGVTYAFSTPTQIGVS